MSQAEQKHKLNKPVRCEVSRATDSRLPLGLSSLQLQRPEPVFHRTDLPTTVTVVRYHRAKTTRHMADDLLIMAIEARKRSRTRPSGRIGCESRGARTRQLLANSHVHDSWPSRTSCHSQRTRCCTEAYRRPTCCSMCLCQLSMRWRRSRFCTGVGRPSTKEIFSAREST